MTNEHITVKISDEKGDNEIIFSLNNDELKEFLSGKVFQALLDDLCKVSFER